MIGNVGTALKRKLGPLPAWAWAGVALVAVLFYRRYKAQQGGGVVSPISPVGEIQGGQTPQDPFGPLQPGEGVYDPNTGQLQTNPSTPGSGAGSTDTTPTDNTPPAAPGVAPPRTKVPPPKRKPKPKGPPHKAVPHPTAKKKTRARAGAIVKKQLTHSAIKSATQKLPKPHAVIKKMGATAPKPGRSVATMPPQAALRQRPAPPLVVHPAAQKVIQNTPVHVAAAVKAAAPAAKPAVTKAAIKAAVKKKPH